MGTRSGFGRQWVTVGSFELYQGIEKFSRGVYYNDIDPYCCKVLSKNIERGYLPKGDIDARDIRDIQPGELMGYQHIHLFAGIGGFPLGMARAGYPLSLRTITGGFPCQDISLAGKGAGIEGERSGLWKEMYRLVCTLRPDYVLVENVAALLYRGISTVLRDLAQSGYDAQWQVLRASDFGAPHCRERVFIVAYPCGKRPQEIFMQSPIFHAAQRERIASGRGGLSTWGTNAKWVLWPPESGLVRVADGIPARVDRLRALGNAIVPQCVEYVARCIMDYEQGKVSRGWEVEA